MIKYCTLLIINTSLFLMLLHCIRVFFPFLMNAKVLRSAFPSLLWQRLSLRVSSIISICIGIVLFEYCRQFPCFLQISKVLFIFLIAVMVLFLIGQPVQFCVWVLWLSMLSNLLLPKLVKLCNP